MGKLLAQGLCSAGEAQLGLGIQDVLSLQGRQAADDYHSSLVPWYSAGL